MERISVSFFFFHEIIYTDRSRIQGRDISIEVRFCPTWNFILSYLIFISSILRNALISSILFLSRFILEGKNKHISNEKNCCNETLFISLDNYLQLLCKGRRNKQESPSLLKREIKKNLTNKTNRQIERMEIGDVASYWHAKQRRPYFPSEKKTPFTLPSWAQAFRKKTAYYFSLSLFFIVYKRKWKFSTQNILLNQLLKRHVSTIFDAQVTTFIKRNPIPNVNRELHASLDSRNVVVVYIYKILGDKFLIKAGII